MKPQEINPQETTRAEAFELWMNSPNPMVTFFKKIDVTNLVHISRKYKWKFNMLLCWCIHLLYDVRQEGAWATRVSFVYSTKEQTVYYVENNHFECIQTFTFPLER